MYLDLNKALNSYFSIRMPSFFNGIFGHKPSTGIVPNGPGQIPIAYGEIDKFLGKDQKSFLYSQEHIIICLVY